MQIYIQEKNNNNNRTNNKIEIIYANIYKFKKRINKEDDQGNKLYQSKSQRR